MSYSAIRVVKRRRGIKGIISSTFILGCEMQSEDTDQQRLMLQNQWFEKGGVYLFGPGGATDSLFQPVNEQTHQGLCPTAKHTCVSSHTHTRTQRILSSLLLSCVLSIPGRAAATRRKSCRGKERERACVPSGRYAQKSCEITTTRRRCKQRESGPMLKLTQRKTTPNTTPIADLETRR